MKYPGWDEHPIQSCPDSICLATLHCLSLSLALSLSLSLDTHVGTFLYMLTYFLCLCVSFALSLSFQTTRYRQRIPTHQPGRSIPLADAGTLAQARTEIDLIKLKKTIVSPMRSSYFAAEMILSAWFGFVACLL